MTSGFSATARSSALPSVGMSPYSLFTDCWSGSFLLRSSAATFSHWSRSSKCRWHESPRRRWRSRGTGTDERNDEQEESYRRGRDRAHSADRVGGVRGHLLPHSESEQRLHDFIGREA